MAVELRLGSFMSCYQIIMKNRNVFACYHLNVIRSHSILPHERLFDILASVFELTSCGIDVIMNEEDDIGGGDDSILDSQGTRLDKSKILFSKMTGPLV